MMVIIPDTKSSPLNKISMFLFFLLLTMMKKKK